MNGWFDEETPLTFKFGYYLSEADMQKDFNEGTQKRMQQLTSWQNNNFVETKLPTGTFNSKIYELVIVGFVSDSDGAERMVSKTIDVRPAVIKKKRM